MLEQSLHKHKQSLQTEANSASSREHHSSQHFKNRKSLNLIIYITPMTSSYSFAFPKSNAHALKLLTDSTVGYLDDSIFYRLDLNTGKAEALYHPEGRTYQAFTSLHKRGMTVLADYGRSSNLYFFFDDSSQNFQIKNVCPLDILQIELSLDGKHLAVACGSPYYRIIFINVEQRKLLTGSKSFIELKGRDKDLKKIRFNPTNRKIVSVTFEHVLEIYEIKECLEVKQTGVESGIIVVPQRSLEFDHLDASVWDQLGNIYLGSEHRLWIWSSESGKQIASYDIQLDDPDNLVRAIILTQKHVILFYSNGRAQWLIKYYPQLLDEDSTSKPFQLDRYYEGSKKVVHALYNHQFNKIILAYDDGFLGTLEIEAEKYPEDEEDDPDGKKKNREPKKLDLDSTTIGPYHRFKIILIHEIEGTSLVITVSKGGRVILWSGKERKQVGYFDTEGTAICADINNKHNVMAIGRDDGVLQFYNISSFGDPFIFKQIRLTKGTPLEQIIFSSTSEELAILSKSQKRIYYILTSLAMNFEVLGYVALPQTPLHIAWHVTQKTAVKPKHEYILACIGFGLLVVNSPAAVPTKKRGAQLNLQTEVYGLRTDLDLNFVASLPSGQILMTGQDKFIKKYRQPEELIAKIDFKSKFPIPAPIEQIEAHDLRITCWTRKGKYLVSASADGTVQIRDVSSLTQSKSYHVGGWKQESISYVSPSDSGTIYIGSVGGCFQVWPSQGAALTDEHKVEQANFKRLPKDRETKYFEIMIEEEYLERMKDVIIGKKKVQFEKLAKIRSELQQLLAENEKHDELERMDRDEFAIDLESREKMDQKGKEKCDKIREESKIKILKCEVLTKKLKQITWDRMNIHLKGINGLKNNFIAFNYQLRKVSKQEKRILEIIFDLRRAQKKELRKHENQLNYEFYSNRNVVNGGVVQPLILSGTEKKQEKKEEKGKKKKEEDVGATQAEQQEEIFNEEEWALLYNSFELYSDNAKRNQIVMMKHLILRIKETFNKEFEKMLKLRQNQGDIINDKNKRIEEICEELKRPNDCIRPRKNILESNDSVLEVKPEEIGFKRYLSREEREKLEKQRKKEEERLRKLAEDDSSQRALVMMMGGTLEQKKTSVLEMIVEREKWMDKPIDEMSEEQKTKLKQYEQKRQKAEEEKQRIVKKLEAQLRKLKLQIDDIMEKYDEKLFQLIKRRLQYDYRIEEQELYCTRLYLSICSVKEQQGNQKQLLQKLEESKKNLGKIQSQKEALVIQQEEMQKSKEAKHAALDARKLGDIESKIKTIQKSIFDEYQSNHKKRKELEQKLLASEPHYKNQLVRLDPMRQIQSKYLSFQKAKDFHFFVEEIKVLQQTYDIPEGSLYQILQHRFNIRKQELDLDNRIRAMKDTLILLQEKQIEAEGLLRKQQKDLEDINNYLTQAESDLEIECRIKQGQVQINNEKPVPELNQALLISKSEIEEKNAKIITNANEKIKVMQQIKTCKISVTEETLNLEKKEDLINVLNSRIKQIQMLKVKKEMQVALAKKDTKVNENQIKSLKEQIEKVRKEGEKRITHFQKKIEKVGSEIETIKKENKQLQTQKWNLETTVRQREKIKEMMVGENGEGNQEAKEKFEQIAINRKLFDKAKQQTEQIELLREQLSKLKAKTFANFSNANK